MPGPINAAVIKGPGPMDARIFFGFTDGSFRENRDLGRFFVGFVYHLEKL